MHAPPHNSPRRYAAVIAGALTSASICGGCIPDLAAIADASVAPADGTADAGARPPGDGSVDSTLPSNAGCGDGVIDLSAGEQCDPGPSGANGCTAACKINCPSGFIDPSTSHCYFLGSLQTSLGGATSKCTSDTAHVVTFVSDDEWQLVAAHIGDAGAPAFWVGLEYDSTAKGYLASNQYEPGWEPLSVCPGCYAFQNNALDAGLPKAPLSGATTGGCVIADLSNGGGWYQWPCSSSLPLATLCEREPPGSYARVCDAGICVSIPKTYPNKEYLYGSSLESSSSAASACDALTGGPLGTGALVTLQSREEREQLWRALENPPETPSPSRFWIGLSTPADASADAPAIWTWSDGTTDGTSKYPTVWAAGQPAAGAGGQASCQWNQYAYDKDLAHSTSAGMTMPYVCQF